MTSIQFSDYGIQILQSRSLDSQEIDRFSEIINDAKQEDKSAIDFLKLLSQEELNLVQKANSLAEPINIGDLSSEGAQNLLSRPDGSDRVDLNNDGIVEVGIGKTIQFPPVNAPQFVKDAWNASIEGLSSRDIMILEANMHMQIYGLQVEGLPQKRPLPLEEQWSATGIENLFTQLNSNLEFRVQLEGWTEFNQQLSAFYNRFEKALTENLTLESQSETADTSPLQSEQRTFTNDDSSINQNPQNTP